MAPTTPQDALAWIKEALAAGHYHCDPHLYKRLSQRRVTMADIKNAVALARECKSYQDRAPTAGGTNWRVSGPDLDDDEITIGVEAYESHGKRALVITVF